MADPASRFTGLALDADVSAALEAVLPGMAERTVTAITAEVPAYADPFSGRMGQNIENAVRASLGAFLRLATRGGDSASDPAVVAALNGAYELGRGAAPAGLTAEVVARFAELIFAYIDELSAASVSGHSDELATAGRARQRYLDLLTRQLLTGEDPQTLHASAETAAWKPVDTLTAVLVPAAQISRLATQLSPAALYLADDLPDLDAAESWAAVLVPDADRKRRSALLSGRRAIVGPARPWPQARSSYLRAVHARTFAGNGNHVIDTDEHLVELVLGADADAAADLRQRALEPLAPLGGKTVDRLAETLRSWLLNQGRREAVAADLFIHPQTVRYRMNQIRQMYGETLNNPQTVLELTVALGYSPANDD